MQLSPSLLRPRQVWSGHGETNQWGMLTRQAFSAQEITVPRDYICAPPQGRVAPGCAQDAVHQPRTHFPRKRFSELIDHKYNFILIK